MEAAIGERVILLVDMVVDKDMVAPAAQICIVEAINGSGIKLNVKSNSTWRKGADCELMLTLNDLSDPHRFLRIRDQVIDGMLFRASRPEQSGFYWMFGRSSRLSERVALYSIEVRNHGKGPVQYWFGGDMQWGRECELEGVWALQSRPRFPGIKVDHR